MTDDKTGAYTMYQEGYAAALAGRACEPPSEMNNLKAPYRQGYIAGYTAIMNTMAAFATYYNSRELQVASDFLAKRVDLI